MKLKPTKTRVVIKRDEDVTSDIIISVNEAVRNGIIHGNKYDTLKQVEIIYHIEEERLGIEIKDEGSGFNLDNVADPLKPENLLKPGGRGILFMRSMMDAVDYYVREEDSGTVVFLAKNRIIPQDIPQKNENQ